jgi:5'-3' exoribonuclease 2
MARRYLHADPELHAPLPACRKYPKIISRVEEDDPQRIPAGEGEEDVVIPVDISGKNPNGEEYDNLYLDVRRLPC